MEYPTLFTAGTRWLAPRATTTPEGVTVHECGHQFWYGLVGNNEFEHAWMDEGLNTVLDRPRDRRSRSARTSSPRAFFGGFIPWVFHDVPAAREIDGDRLAGYRAAARKRRALDAVLALLPRHGRHITYNKTALWLHTLER